MIGEPEDGATLILDAVVAGYRRSTGMEQGEVDPLLSGWPRCRSAAACRPATTPPPAGPFHSPIALDQRRNPSARPGRCDGWMDGWLPVPVPLLL